MALKVDSAICATSRNCWRISATDEFKRLDTAHRGLFYLFSLLRWVLCFWLLSETEYPVCSTLRLIYGFLEAEAPVIMKTFGAQSPLPTPDVQRTRCALVFPHGGDEKFFSAISWWSYRCLDIRGFRGEVKHTHVGQVRYSLTVIKSSYDPLRGLEY